MANIIKVKSDMDFTGSNGGRDIPCYVFDGEPTAEQLAECHANGISAEWANGEIYEPDYAKNIDYARQNEISLSVENIFWWVVKLFALSVVLSIVYAAVMVLR